MIIIKMCVDLIIDYRENALLELLQNENIIKENLDLGDIVFKQKGDIILIIERKTINDLKASICDGRHREQKARLLGCEIDNQRIMYLIEGNMDKDLNTKINGLPLNTLLGSLINTQLRDGIKIYKTQSINESVNFIIKLWEKLKKDGDKYFNDDIKTISNSEYSSTLKQKKKTNMTPDVWFITQLCLIPQLSSSMAGEIHKEYQSVYKLINIYERTPEHLRSKLLSDITYPLKSGKTRRIGDKISGRVYEYFYSLK